MEILTNKRKCDTILDDAGGTAKSFEITNLKQGVKNPNRVNVFVNGKYEFSLDISQVVDFKIKVGMRISETLLQEYKKASEYGKLYQRTLEWVLLRPRSVRETRDYLQRKIRQSSSGALPGDFSSFSDKIIERLAARGYLDDLKFAEWYVENRFVKKGISQKRMRMELARKGVSHDVVDEVLGGRNEEEEIRKMIARKRARYDDDKLIQYLCRQGFPYEMVRNLVQTYETD